MNEGNIAYTIAGVLTFAILLIGSIVKIITSSRKKHSKIYELIGEKRKEIDKEFVRKEVYEVQQEAINKDIQRIRQDTEGTASDVKILLGKIGA